MNMMDRFRALLTGLTSPERYARRMWLAFRPQAGVFVDDHTAMTFAAYFCALRVVSETLMTLPWYVVSYDESGRFTAKPDHQVTRILNFKANRELSARRFREIMCRWAMSWGNAYAEIERDARGQPVNLWPIHPNRITRVYRVDDGPLLYDVMSDTLGVVTLSAREMFHVMGPSDDPHLGLSVLQYAARSIGIGIAQDLHVASYMQQGATPSGVLTYPKRVPDAILTRLRESWADAHGGPRNAGKPIILEEGMDWKAMGVNPRDAQLLESRNFTVEDIARWFRIPPHKLMKLDRATWANIEHMGIEFKTDTVIPWVTRFEQEADIKLLRLDREETRMDTRALDRGDSKTRSEYYTSMRSIGAINANEIREMEGMNPIPGKDGEKYTMQSGFTTLEQVGKEPAAPANVPGVQPNQNPGRERPQPQPQESAQ